MSKESLNSTARQHIHHNSRQQGCKFLKSLHNMSRPCRPLAPRLCHSHCTQTHHLSVGCLFCVTQMINSGSLRAWGVMEHERRRRQLLIRLSRLSGGSATTNQCPIARPSREMCWGIDRTQGCLDVTLTLSGLVFFFLFLFHWHRGNASNHANRNYALLPIRASERLIDRLPCNRFLNTSQ